MPKQKGSRLYGRVRVNGKCRTEEGDNKEYRQAYITQQDLFYSQLTVRETLMMYVSKDDVGATTGSL